MIQKEKIQTLWAKLEPLAPYSKHSRVHKLKTVGFSSHPCFIKRDDELSFGISGSKLRKFLSLIPALKRSGAEEVVIIGSAYSNNVVGLSQLLIENSLKPTLFLLGESSPQKPQGNLLLTSLLVPLAEVQWIPREEWSTVYQKAQEYVRTQSSHKIQIIPEGACMSESLSGAMTLPLDILENEKALKQDFQHIFMEAGTGLMAIATILGFAWLQKNICVHVVLLAEDEKTFRVRLQSFKKTFEDFMGDIIKDEIIESIFKVYTPSQCMSFGAPNASLFQEIAHVAREEGFFLDPIYSAKLFLKTKEILQDRAISGNSLMIHSGGALTLLGFQEQLLKTISFKKQA
jgi:1-aminocyclopropane-1-carboxylate deaminase/D-cysteine desulfhydrase-like pyridoxal-dependent ACC family enzyme